MAFGALADSDAAENPAVLVTQLSAQLEMRNFRDTAKLAGPFKIGIPVTLTFRNNAKVTVIPMKIDPDVIKLSARLIRGGGAVLYKSTFFTHYNVDADLSEKNPNGDLIYRLKLDPQIQSE